VTFTATFSRFLQFDAANRAILLEALVSVAAASAAIRLIPFRKVVKFAAGSRREAMANDPDLHMATIRRARWAVAAVADRVPWKAVCFQRGLALHWMLRRRGFPSLLHYGVAQDGGRELSAHVWLSYGGEIVLGGEEAGRFACLATFPPSAAS